jgi:sulfide:quinone oxidoreductase
MNSENYFDVLIIGAGTGGITVAAQMAKEKIFEKIAVIDPASTHYYQPLWTLVGGGVFPKEVTSKPQAYVIPRGVSWIQEAVTEIHPGSSKVLTSGKNEYTYRHLIVAPGMEIFWDRIHGLKEALESHGENGVCSNYSFDTVEGTWRAIKNVRTGRAIFTFPNTPIKCGGAPQKIMYLAEDYFRKTHVRKNVEVLFASAGASIFAVKKYADALNKVIAKRDIKTSYGQNLVEIQSQAKKAIFESGSAKERVTVDYEMIHVTPPMGAPGFIRASGLSDANGFTEVDKYTLQHLRFPNVWGLGDSSSLPTSRTGAAIRKQAPVLIENLIAVTRGEVPRAKYNGYTSCPLVTGYGKLILAEFDYDLNPVESFPFDQGKERRSMYWLKKYVLPILYWDGMLKGRA